MVLTKLDGSQRKPKFTNLGQGLVGKEGEGTDTEIGGKRGYGKRIIRMHYIQL